MCDHISHADHLNIGRNYNAAKYASSPTHFISMPLNNIVIEIIYA